MSAVEQVALWVGLLSGVVSIVLSVVAIWFAVYVDRGARQVTAQTIKSLQKIESEVERSSSDTRELIKAGWDKMLGSVPRSASEQNEGAAKDIAAGVAAELRAELAGLTGGAADVAAVESRIKDTLERLEETIAAQIRTEASTDTAASMVDQAMQQVTGLSIEAQAIAREIARAHLTRRQYLQLIKGPLASAVKELRGAGLLVPLQGVDDDGNEIPVYYFPPRFSRAVRAVLQLTDPPPEHIHKSVDLELQRVGYSDR